MMTRLDESSSDVLPPEVTSVSSEELAAFKQCKRVGFYLLGKTIGEGSFAKVKEAIHTLTGEKVAVKVIDKKRANEDRYVRKNLRREAHILQLVRHPSVVHLLEVMETEHYYYLVMELCAGGELLDFICARKRLDEDTARRIVGQLVAAVNCMHHAGVVHRDLKIENLLLDEGGNLKIVDFGLSNTLPTNCNVVYEQTKVFPQLLNTHCGSPAYAAPELLAQKPYGPQVDVWSIGINMFAMLSGFLPYMMEPFNVMEMYGKMMQRKMAPIPGFLSVECKDLILRLLEPNPERRITLDQVLLHPWLRCRDPVRPSDSVRDVTCGQREFCEPVLTYMKNVMGIPLQDTVKAVTSNRAVHCSAVYHLLVGRLVRHRKSRGDVPTRRHPGGESLRRKESNSEDARVGDLKKVSHDVAIQKVEVIRKARLNGEMAHVGNARFTYRGRKIQIAIKSHSFAQDENSSFQAPADEVGPTDDVLSEAHGKAVGTNKLRSQSIDLELADDAASRRANLPTCHRQVRSQNLDLESSYPASLQERPTDRSCSSTSVSDAIRKCLKCDYGLHIGEQHNPAKESGKCESVGDHRDSVFSDDAVVFAARKMSFDSLLADIDTALMRVETSTRTADSTWDYGFEKAENSSNRSDSLRLDVSSCDDGNDYRLMGDRCQVAEKSLSLSPDKARESVDSSGRHMADATGWVITKVVKQPPLKCDRDIKNMTVIDKCHLGVTAPADRSKHGDASSKSGLNGICQTAGHSRSASRDSPRASDTECFSDRATPELEEIYSKRSSQQRDGPDIDRLLATPESDNVWRAPDRDAMREIHDDSRRGRRLFRVQGDGSMVEVDEGAANVPVISAKRRNSSLTSTSSDENGVSRGGPVAESDKASFVRSRSRKFEAKNKENMALGNKFALNSRSTKPCVPVGTAFRSEQVHIEVPPKVLANSPLKSAGEPPLVRPVVAGAPILDGPDEPAGIFSDPKKNGSVEFHVDNVIAPIQKIQSSKVAKKITVPQFVPFGGSKKGDSEFGTLEQFHESTRDDGDSSAPESPPGKPSVLQPLDVKLDFRLPKKRPEKCAKAESALSTGPSQGSSHVRHQHDTARPPVEAYQSQPRALGSANGGTPQPSVDRAKAVHVKPVSTTNFQRKVAPVFSRNEDSAFRPPTVSKADFAGAPSVKQTDGTLSKGDSAETRSVKLTDDAVGLRRARNSNMSPSEKKVLSSMRIRVTSVATPAVDVAQKGNGGLDETFGKQVIAASECPIVPVKDQVFNSAGEWSFDAVRKSRVCSEASSFDSGFFGDKSAEEDEPGIAVIRLADSRRSSESSEDGLAHQIESCSAKFRCLPVHRPAVTRTARVYSSDSATTLGVIHEETETARKRLADRDLMYRRGGSVRVYPTQERANCLPRAAQLSKALAQQQRVARGLPSTFSDPNNTVVSQSGQCETIKKIREKPAKQYSIEKVVSGAASPRLVRKVSFGDASRSPSRSSTPTIYDFEVEKEKIESFTAALENAAWRKRSVKSFQESLV